MAANFNPVELFNENLLKLLRECFTVDKRDGTLLNEVLSSYPNEFSSLVVPPAFKSNDAMCT